MIQKTNDFHFDRNIHNNQMDIFAKEKVDFQESYGSI